MLKSNILLVVLCLITLSVSITAQKILEKPVDQWSQAEAKEVLNGSAWSQIYTSNEGNAAAAANQALRDQADNRLSGSERSRTDRLGAPPPIVIRLHSGLPIRLALTRLNQIAAGYEKMDEKGRAAFNESGRGLMECAPCQKYYVVSITQFPNPSGNFVEEAIFEGMTLEQMKPHVSMKNDKGEIRELAQFIAPKKRGDSAVFFFTRKDSAGKDFVTKENKDFTFTFNGSFFTSSNRFAYLIPKKFDFKVSKIMVGDQVVF
jgi:hypothetical protein